MQKTKKKKKIDLEILQRVLYMYLRQIKRVEFIYTFQNSNFSFHPVYRSLACMYSNRAIIISKSNIVEGSEWKYGGTTLEILSGRNYVSAVTALFASIAERRSIRNIAVDRGSCFAVSKALALQPEGTTTRVPPDHYAIQLLVTSLSCSAVETICPFACPFVSPAQTARTRLYFNPLGEARWNLSISLLKKGTQRWTFERR